MAFTVTFRAETAAGGTIEDRYGDDDDFTIHDSGALIVTRPNEELIYAPGAWIRLHKSSDQSEASAGNYI
ncbi:hypothetical protein [Rhodococcus sp. NPDC059234]|uniref:hypothetical protein n=1 Tax=Rhodococcus sp. NPDC059234 TaxID=3346781 RepID=UPI003672C958